MPRTTAGKDPSWQAHSHHTHRRRSAGNSGPTRGPVAAARALSKQWRAAGRAGHNPGMDGSAADPGTAADDSATPARLRIRVEGIVQGVGFRPYVYALANRHRLAGLVGNDARGVFIEVEGTRERVEGFRRDLTREPPPLALVERVVAHPVAVTGQAGFTVAPSEPGGERQTLISPDTATCADCLRELFDPADRRYRYPFVNCTNCGPRFTIIRDVPYDRPGELRHPPLVHREHRALQEAARHRTR